MNKNMLREVTVSKELLSELLLQLLEWEALEFCPSDQERELLVPFVMNDAVECYLKFENCSVRGEIETENLLDSTLEFVEDGASAGIILRQPSGNTAAIWYQEVKKVTNCRQYHRIGHGWRKKAGEEHIRRLINLLCVIHDKRRYLGPEYCNETERWLADLVEFEPFLYYTPINESIREWYPHTVQGINAAKRIVQSAGQLELYQEICRYEQLFEKGKIKDKQVKILAEKLATPDAFPVWQKLEEEIRKASEVWPSRIYPEQKSAEINKKREMIAQRYCHTGFSGEYPELFSAEEIIQFVEEQPFTVMEEENFTYRIFSIKRQIPTGRVRWKSEEEWTF